MVRYYWLRGKYPTVKKLKRLNKLFRCRKNYENSSIHSVENIYTYPDLIQSLILGYSVNYDDNTPKT